MKLFCMFSSVPEFDLLYVPGNKQLGTYVEEFSTTAGTLIKPVGDSERSTLWISSVATAPHRFDSTTNNLDIFELGTHIYRLKFKGTPHE
jgi:hypothetical protein